MTGLPEPHVAVQAVGMPAMDSSMRNPLLLQDAGQVLRRLDLLKAKFAEAEDLIHHLLGEVLHSVDFTRQLGLVPRDRGINHGRPGRP